MNSFSKLLYKIGGYDPQIIKAGQLGSKHILPGLSLLIVFITSSYGGWHLADTISSGWYRLPYTFGFVSIIILVDYLLLQGEKSHWSASMRVILSITLGFVISLLTILTITESDIIANNNTNIDNDTKKETSQRTKDIAFWKSLNSDSIPKYDALSTKAHKGDYVTNDGKKIPACGVSELEQSYCRTFARTSERFQNIYNENKNKVADEENYIIGKKKEVIARNSNGIVGQIGNLWQLMLNNGVVLAGVILFFIALMVIDLMPISVKFGIKDKLDSEYEAKKNELQNERDEDGNPLWYNVEKDKFFMETQKERGVLEELKLQAKNELELKRIQAKNDSELNKSNEETIKGMNSLYAQEKYIELLEYFKTKNIPEDAIKTIFDKLHSEAQKENTNER